MVLDVGCGTRKAEPDALGIDFSPRSAADVVWNLDDFPWPLESDAFGRIHMSHIIEHVRDVMRTMAEVLRRDDRIVILSALWALGDLHDNLPGNVAVGSPDFVASLTNLLKDPPPLRRKWERLGELLREAEPRSALARWLDRARLTALYQGSKRNLRRILNKLPVVGSMANQALDQVRDGLKALLTGGMLFVLLGPVGQAREGCGHGREGAEPRETARVAASAGPQVEYAR